MITASQLHVSENSLALQVPAAREENCKAKHCNRQQCSCKLPQCWPPSN